MPNLHVIVVSLLDQFERRKSIIDQLSHLGISFEFHNAADLRTIDSNTLQNLVASDPSASIKRSLTKGEIGCSMSHFQAYEKFLLGNSQIALILEDDANLERLEARILHVLVNDMPSDIVILGYSKVMSSDESFIYSSEPVFKKKSIDKYIFGPVYKNWTCGTVSYLISRAAAKAIIDSCYVSNRNKIVTVADDWKYFEKQAKLSIFHVRPLLVTESFNIFESSIESARSVVSKERNKSFDFIRVLRGKFRWILLYLRNYRTILK